MQWSIHKIHIFLNYESTLYLWFLSFLVIFSSKQTINLISSCFMFFLLSLFHSPCSSSLILLWPDTSDRATGGASLEWPLTLQLTSTFICWDIPPVPTGGKQRWRREQEIWRQKRNWDPKQHQKNNQSPHFARLRGGNCGRFVSRERLLFHP